MKIFLIKTAYRVGKVVGRSHTRYIIRRSRRWY